MAAEDRRQRIDHGNADTAFREDAGGVAVADLDGEAVGHIGLGEGTADDRAHPRSLFEGDIGRIAQILRCDRRLGCERMLGHRNLEDCFVTPEGAWESHASGCGICIQESRMLERMMGRGMGAGMMADRVIAAFGGPTMST